MTDYHKLSHNDRFGSKFSYDKESRDSWDAQECKKSHVSDDEILNQDFFKP